MECPNKLSEKKSGASEGGVSSGIHKIFCVGEAHPNFWSVSWHLFFRMYHFLAQKLRILEVIIFPLFTWKFKKYIKQEQTSVRSCDETSFN